MTVSYTHLDVYKRQCLHCLRVLYIMEATPKYKAVRANLKKLQIVFKAALKHF